MPNAHPDLWQRYQATKAASTAKYARDIAAEMGISEAELTAARLGHDAVRLSDDARALIAALERVGETKCICRNEYAVHEQVGQFTHQHLQRPRRAGAEPARARPASVPQPVGKRLPSER